MLYVVFGHEGACPPPAPPHSGTMLSLGGSVPSFGFLEHKNKLDGAPPVPSFLPEPPHLILRKGLIEGERYNTLAADMGTYLARTLFFSSSLHLPGAQMKAEISRWSSNSPMCELTEKVGAGRGGGRKGLRP